MEAFVTFICNRSIPRSDSEEEINELVTHKPKPKAFKETFCIPEASTSGITMAVQPILKRRFNRSAIVQWQKHTFKCIFGRL